MTMPDLFQHVRRPSTSTGVPEKHPIAASPVNRRLSRLSVCRESPGATESVPLEWQQATSSPSPASSKENVTQPFWVKEELENKNFSRRLSLGLHFLSQKQKSQDKPRDLPKMALHRRHLEPHRLRPFSATSALEVAVSAEQRPMTPISPISPGRSGRTRLSRTCQASSCAVELYDQIGIKVTDLDDTSEVMCFQALGAELNFG
eukprot:TRINITY_DN10349_c0_g1_i2.p1 TRINITY_DN10349_c0_g1~~TRINITY_DN10349_c0_g1_i2.p1  ORF type:complete len:204 (+),score=31.48 TRINITY_DN10349_c0_g1_i2:147-758(+)